MALLSLLLAGHGAYVPDPPPGGGGGDPVPGENDPMALDPDAQLYVPATSPPYNSPMRLVTPTYDGSGDAIHPSVIDFGETGWNGWRYWMVHTPFHDNDDNLENPSIAVSNNGYYWQLPLGAPDPLYPAPPGTGFNSDTHLVYDPDADEIIVLFRQTLDRSAHTYYIARSGDGVTWPATPTALSLTWVGSDVQAISPSLIRVAAGDWRIFALSYVSKALTMWKAPAAEGPWAGPFNTVGVGVGGPTWNWHLGVHLDDTGVFRALVDRGPVHEGRDDGYRPSSSPDGMTWSTTTSDFMDVTAPPAWDSGELYRAIAIDDEAGTHFRVWYSAHTTPEEGPNVWGLGYAEVPRTVWPAPPASPVAGAGTAYQTLALGHGSSVMWRMGGDPLTTTVEPDASGNSRVGTYAGRWVRSSPLTGEAGYASRLDQGSVWRSHEAWMSPAAYTVRAVVRFENLFSGKTIAALHGSAGGWLLRTSGATLQFVHTASGVTISGGTVTTGTTYHVAVTVDGAGLATVYRNGAAINTGSVTGAASTTGARLSVGGRWDGTDMGEYFQGLIEYVDLCPTALSPAQILASAQAAGVA